ncbi:MAG: hypothetical protein U0547_07870 [Dehalococcoidia bacterium]
MLKTRVLLLGTALAAFGAIMASSAIANITGTASVSGNPDVGVQQLANLSGQLSSIDNTIVANGNAQHVANIDAAENDPSYAIGVPSVNGISLNQGGVSVVGCGSTSSAPYSLANPANRNVDLVENTWTNVGELQVAITLDASNGCAISGAVLTINFEAVAGVDG